MNIPNFSDIEEAFARIEQHIHITPVLTSQSINEITGANLFFKCENLQKVGAFKIRGAINAVFSLSDEEVAKGVATHSSGNHAAALALAAKLRGVEAHIVMPNTAPEVKKKAVAGYGAKITYCEPTLKDREETLVKIVAETGAKLVHPYNQAEVIAGQGTCALELMGQVEGLDAILTPVGGGGLLAGTALSAKYLDPDIELIAAEPEGADDAYQSFLQEKLVPAVNPKSIADGLLTSLGEFNYEIIKNNVDAVITAPDKAIVEAMRMIWERMKIIVEPSAAITLAIILENKEAFKGKTVGIILTGGNVDLEKLPF